MAMIFASFCALVETTGGAGGTSHFKHEATLSWSAHIPVFRTGFTTGGKVVVVVVVVDVVVLVVVVVVVVVVGRGSTGKSGTSIFLSGTTSVGLKFTLLHASIEVPTTSVREIDFKFIETSTTLSQYKAEASWTLIGKRV